MRGARSRANQIRQEIRSLREPNTPRIRAIRRRHSRALRNETATKVLELAQELQRQSDHRWVAWELIRYHPAALEALGRQELERLGEGALDSWWSVDAFALFLAGPAWLRGQIPDELIHEWAHSDNLWWRRAALVSTVVLNTPSHGGRGDVPRTLAVCQLLVNDREDMVVKALSWAVRKVVQHDPEAVRRFLDDNEDALAPRVKREVLNKLRTGLKNPRREPGERGRSA